MAAELLTAQTSTEPTGDCAGSGGPVVTSRGALAACEVRCVREYQPLAQTPLEQCAPLVHERAAEQRAAYVSATSEASTAPTRRLLGSAWSPFRAMELAGYKEGAARELVASLSPLAQAERAAAIALLPEAVTWGSIGTKWRTMCTTGT